MFEKREEEKDAALKMLSEKFGLELDKLPELVGILSDVFYCDWGKKEDGTPDYEKIFALSLKRIATLARIKGVIRNEQSNVIENGWLKPGTMVRVRPCADEYKDKTFFGIYIGEIAQGVSGNVKEDMVEFNFSGHNPAILIPSLNKIVYGFESWWQEIKSPEDVKDISDEDIQNVPYVKALMAMYSKEE